MQCPQCKQTMEPGVRYCPNDGTPLSDTAAAPTVTSPNNGRPASQDLELPVIVGGRYRLEKLLGGGGMAKVYRGVDLTLEREVAVKLINADLRADPEFDARFQREARIASQLSDPHIIVVHDYGLDPALGPYLVMELLQGCSLRERLQAEGPLPLRAGLQLSGQLMLALLHAHEKGIVHRDIKPDNIFLLNQSGVRLHVRVLDFGIARMYKRGEAGPAEALTATGAVVGTPRYMSPEQLAGEGVDARSDLYSAALVIHEALTGHMPYISGKKMTELCPEASSILQDLVDHCLKQNPADRPASAVEVYLRLQELGKASGVLLLPTGAMDRLVAARHAKESGNPVAKTKRKQPSSLPIYFVAIMAILIALLGLLSLGKRIWFPPSQQRSPAITVETLLGLRIGDSEDEVTEKLKKAKITISKEITGVNPWAKEPPPAYLGHILKPSDLNLGEDEEPLNHLTVKHNVQEDVCVILYDGKVIAVVVQKPAKGTTSHGGGVSIGDSVGDLEKLSDLDVSANTIQVPDSKGGSHHPMVWRYEQLGVGFLVQNNKITSITLYPAKGEP